MFETLTKGFRSARQRLSGLTELTEENIEQALRDVRLSLLEADVEFNVVKRFLAAREGEGDRRGRCRPRPLVQGQKVKVGPAERFIKICHDELVGMMSARGRAAHASRRSPRITGIMMVGLQGSGKTTSTAKLARCSRSEGKKPLLVAADMQRPGAIEQLQVLGERVDVPVFAIPGGDPVEICATRPATRRASRSATSSSTTPPAASRSTSR